MSKTWFERNETRLRFTQGCLTDCVAYFFNLHPVHVPFFVYPRKGWNDRLKAFFRRHGYEAHWVDTAYGTRSFRIPKRGLSIVCGNSLRWKTAAHVVVYRDGKLAYDPQYPSLWNDKRITHRLVVRKL